MMLTRPLALAHRLVEAALPPGGVAVDATVGNGHDTVFLAEQVGREGRVFGFDIQEGALAATRRRLQVQGLVEQVTLFLAGHEDMAEHLPDEVKGRVDAIMFNLGYLPGSDKRTITRPETTVRALEAALAMLRPGGVVTVVVYPGHPGGEEEAEAVAAWAVGLSPETATAASFRVLNRSASAPWLLVIHKPTP